MTEKTMLVLPGKRVSVPRPVKRSFQIAAAVAITAVVALAIVAGSGLLVGFGGGRAVAQPLDVWLAFIQRTDILSTMILTAVVTVLFVYWQRDKEREGGGGRR